MFYSWQWQKYGVTLEAKSRKKERKKEKNTGKI